ncbi:MAG: hypothetical protein Q9184_003340 [Pyrenodesmia sp. 2 TL-2023]
MFYDLNVPYTANHAELQRTLAFIAELGYNTVALSHTINGKLPADLTCPIPSPLPISCPKNLRILTRCTLHLSDPSQNHRVSTLASNYTLLAVRPISEKTLQQACISLAPIDLISLDCSIRYPFYFRQKALLAAVERGVRIEICYGVGILGTGDQKRNLISNATQLVRATRGRGLVVSSEAGRTLSCRGPWDVVNLAGSWGLGKERGVEALGREARGVVVAADMRKSSYRGVVDVVFAGEKPADGLTVKGQQGATKGKMGQNGKRKAEDEGLEKDVDKPLSKTQMRKRARQAKLEELKEIEDVPDKAVPDSKGSTMSDDVLMLAKENQVVAGVDIDDVTATLLTAGDPIDDETATLFTALAEATVWKADFCATEEGPVSDIMAPIGNADNGQRHEQSQASAGALEVVAAARNTVDAGVLAVALELGIVKAADMAGSI